MFVFGGMDMERGFLDDFYCFNIGTAPHVSPSLDQSLFCIVLLRFISTHS